MSTLPEQQQKNQHSSSTCCVLLSINPLYWHKITCETKFAASATPQRQYLKCFEMGLRNSTNGFHDKIKSVDEFYYIIILQFLLIFCKDYLDKQAIAMAQYMKEKEAYLKSLSPQDLIDLKTSRREALRKRAVKRKQKVEYYGWHFVMVCLHQPIPNTLVSTPTLAKPGLVMLTGTVCSG